jgi:hypothetical protein
MVREATAFHEVEIHRHGTAGGNVRMLGRNDQGEYAAALEKHGGVDYLQTGSRQMQSHNGIARARGRMGKT